jgi:hypothetical protein
MLLMPERLVVVALEGFGNELFFELSDLVGIEQRLLCTGNTLTQLFGPRKMSSIRVCGAAVSLPWELTKIPSE